jgi:hypothetical protein
MSWFLDEGAAARFDPPMAGWEIFHGLYSKEFPEVAGRRMVAQRDFWVRGSGPARERLIVEWEHPWHSVIVIILNGVVYDQPMTAEEFDGVWMRAVPVPGERETMTEEELWFGPAEAPFRFQGEMG